MRLPAFLFHATVVTVLGAAPATRAEVTYSKNGVVIIRSEDFQAEKEKITARFKATRWGMYELLIDGNAKTGLKATVNGEGPRRTQGRSSGTLGVFYLAKAGPGVIEVTGRVEGTTALSLVPACEGEPVVQKGAEAIALDAKDALVTGVMLRYEPNPKKLCLGYWGNPNDAPIWSYTVTTPGNYEVILTQGCGRGAGGSKAVVETAGASLEFVVKDTGGYQKWEDRSLGTVTFKKAGAQQLKVRVLKKARGIMDIRRIVLKPVAK